MGTLLKFILFFVIFFWLSSKVIGFVIRTFGLSGSSRDPYDRNFRRDDRRREGIHVDYAPDMDKEKTRNRRDDVGEYIDYEEVKE